MFTVSGISIARSFVELSNVVQSDVASRIQLGRLLAETQCWCGVNQFGSFRTLALRHFQMFRKYFFSPKIILWNEAHVQLHCDYGKQ
jgi:hypothetical protein